MPTVLQFEPRLMRLLIIPHEAASRRVTVRYTTSDAADPWKAAQRLRARLHQLRAAMKREGHPGYAAASKLHVGARRISPEVSEVTIRVVDEELLAPIDRALANETAA